MRLLLRSVYLFNVLWLIPLQAAGQNPDIDLLRHFNLQRNPRLDPAFRIITQTSAPVAALVPISLLAYGITTHDTVAGMRAVTMGVTVLATHTFTTLLKYGIRRPRPYITYPDIEKLTGAGSPSFPSGHTSNAFALAISVSLAFPKWYMVLPVCTWAGTVGYSRMHLGVHYPTDVLAGALLGAGTAYLCHRGQQWLINRRK